MDDRIQRTLDKMDNGKSYTRRELLRLISPQSTTAEYILQDVEASGRIQQTVAGYRRNI